MTDIAYYRRVISIRQMRRRRNMRLLFWRLFFIADSHAKLSMQSAILSGTV